MKILRVYLSHSIDQFSNISVKRLNDIAYAQLEVKRNSEKAKELGSLASCFQLVENPANADFHLLPFTWNWYLKSKQIQLIAEAITKAKRYKKPIVLFNLGDFTANVPFSGIILFQQSAYRSRRFHNGNQVFALPSFTEDFVQIYCNGNLPVRAKNNKPIVGFCGLAGGEWWRIFYKKLELKINWITFRLGLNKLEPPPFEPSAFREKVLKVLESSNMIICNFIRRNRYWAGYGRVKQVRENLFHPIRLEYVKNMLDSDYIVCVRGMGNWSYRFYHALSMGRIPVFIDTDCLLPFDFIINWREYCVWVEEKEINRIDQKIIEFHNRLSSNEFQELQKTLRKIWEKYLTKEGFYKEFYRHFEFLLHK